MDLSLSSPGFAVIRINNKCELVEKGHIKTNTKKSHGYRLKQIEKLLIQLRDKYEYEAVIRERGFSRFPKTTQTLFKVVGICDLTFSDVEIIEIPPTTVKKQVTGDGKADKKDVAKHVRKVLNLNNVKFATDDESDACAVCLAYLIREGLIKFK